MHDLMVFCMHFSIFWVEEAMHIKKVELVPMDWDGGILDVLDW